MTIKFMVGLESIEEDDGDSRDENASPESSPWLEELARAHERSARAECEPEVRASRGQGWLLSGAKRDEDSTAVAIWAW